MLEELPGDVGSFLTKPRNSHTEVTSVSRSVSAVTVCRAHPVADERDLAEMVARAEGGHALAAGGDSSRAVGDDEEPDPALVALLDDDRARREARSVKGPASRSSSLRIEA